MFPTILQGLTTYNRHPVMIGAFKRADLDGKSEHFYCFYRGMWRAKAKCSNAAQTRAYLIASGYRLTGEYIGSRAGKTKSAGHNCILTFVKMD